MAYRDSLDKIVSTYFASVTNEPFIYKGESYLPKSLQVSPLLLRGFICPADCGACCPRFSLDYLPSEKHPYVLEQRVISFNEEKIVIYSDTQTKHNAHHCRNLDMQNGRCGIHGNQPFSCDFELIRFSMSSTDKPNQLHQKLFGRGWAMLRYDLESRGARCEITTTTNETIDDAIRKLRRLQEWCLYFGIQNNKCESIITWIQEIRGFLNWCDVKPVIISS